MFAGPWNAQNMIVFRPFSSRRALVSLPLPVKSKYATLRSDKIRNVSYPYGDKLTCPSRNMGAVPTKNRCCLWIKALCSGDHLDSTRFYSLYERGFLGSFKLLLSTVLGTLPIYSKDLISQWLLLFSGRKISICR